MKRNHIMLACAGSIAAAISAAQTPAVAGQSENCYGVSLKGQNDCAVASHACAGQSTVDYDGGSWTSVPKGTCTSLKTPFGPGALAQIKRPA
jgi:uncharacterized membrane protein